MDNFTMKVVGEGDSLLAKVIEIGFSNRRGPACAYAISPERGLIFLNSYEDGHPRVALPFKLDAAGAADFARRWLSEQSYGREPDHDGDNGKGWTVYTEGWGHVGPYHGAICAVLPTWAMYGK